MVRTSTSSRTIKDKEKEVVVAVVQFRKSRVEEEQAGM